MRLCRRLDVHAVLRVDGFYHPSVFGNEDAPRKLTPYLAGINRRLRQDLEMFDHVIYQSAFSKQEADLHLFERRRSYSVIPNGVDTQFLAPKAQPKEQKLTMVTVGRHTSDNIALAFDVMESVRPNLECHLRIVGPLQGGARTTFDDRSRASLFGQDIEYQGVVSYQELPKTLTAADIFLHLKVGDSCPNAVIEAMSCGLPVVCPAWGGTQELVGPAGIAVAGPAWGFDETLSSGMASAVRQIADMLPVYAVRARERAVSEFDRSRMWARYFEVLLDAAN